MIDRPAPRSDKRSASDTLGALLFIGMIEPVRLTADYGLPVGDKKPPKPLPPVAKGGWGGFFLIRAGDSVLAPASANPP